MIYYVDGTVGIDALQYRYNDKIVYTIIVSYKSSTIEDEQRLVTLGTHVHSEDVDELIESTVLSLGNLYTTIASISHVFDAKTGEILRIVDLNELMKGKKSNIILH